MRIAVVEKDPADKEQFTVAMRYAGGKFTRLCGMVTMTDYYESMDEMINAARRPYDAAIIAINNSDDIEAASKFWKAYPNIPVVLVGTEMCGAECYRPGALRYMTKPIYGDNLLTTLRRCNDAVCCAHVHEGRE